VKIAEKQRASSATSAQSAASSKAKPSGKPT
jgi:hypothetical protein